MASQLEKDLKNAQQLSADSNQSNEAVSAFSSVIFAPIKPSDEVNKIKEDACLGVSALYRNKGDAQSIRKFLASLRETIVLPGLTFFATLPQAKTGKIVRCLLEDVAKIPGAQQILIDLCRESVLWAEKEQRTYLRLHLQTKLAAALFQTEQYEESLQLVRGLLKEVKKLDDKQLLSSIFLLESKIHHALHHLPRSRASLTAARTAANAIYCPPVLQAELDMQSGTLHAEERDYKTAYSYFYEAHENYDTISPSELSKAEARELSLLALKYMLFTKIIAGTPEDVSVLVSGGLALHYTDEKLSSIRAIAKAHQQSSLRAFQDALNQFRHELEKDPVIHRHLQQLYQNLLEDNLLRLVLPFSEVEIPHIASLIELDVATVEKKLSKMILNKKLNGILDQGNNCLIVFETSESDGFYPAAVGVISNLGSVVDSLYNRAAKIA